MHEAHALKLKFHEQTEIRYNSVFSPASGQFKPFKVKYKTPNRLEPMLSLPSPKWMGVREQNKTSHDSNRNLYYTMYNTITQFYIVITCPNIRLLGPQLPLAPRVVKCDK